MVAVGGVNLGVEQLRAGLHFPIPFVEDDEGEIKLQMVPYPRFERTGSLNSGISYILLLTSEQVTALESIAEL
jgi:hypothetical protein